MYFWTKEEDQIILDNFDTMLHQDIALLLPNRSHKAVLHRAKALGLKRDMVKWGELISERFDAEMTEKLGEPVDQWLRRRYLDEKATYREICAELGINTRTLMRWMRDHGIEPISSSEAATRQRDIDPDAFLEKLFNPETNAKRAKTLARGRQVNWREFCTAGELAFLKALDDADLACIPQLAIEGYNIDFAFPKAKLAVELDPRWHNSKRKRPLDQKKDARLNELGWTVLRLDARTSTSFNVKKVSDALQSFASTQPR